MPQPLPHECMRGRFAEFQKTMRDVSDQALRLHLKNISPGGQWEGSKGKITTRTHAYRTQAWRLYKLAIRQEAHRRGITI